MGEGAGLWLMMLLPVQIHTLGVRDVFLLGVSKQTVKTWSVTIQPSIAKSRFLGFEILGDVGRY